MRMRKRKLVTRLVASMALALGVFLMSAPGAAAGSADVHAVGAGSIDLGGVRKVVKFALSGHSRPQGDFGSLRLKSDNPLFPFDLHADIDCVNVFPNPPGAGGWLSGLVRRVKPQPNVLMIAPGDRILVGVNDFGEPSDPIADEFNAVRIVPSPLCKLLGPAEHIPIDQGNINIKIDDDIFP
jgi:hypothetical protein